jgi:helicase required for RNAi-mediated heterochromatin assembly 1
LVGLGVDGLTPIPRTPQVNLGLPLEEADLEFEQLQELEQELEGQDFEEDNGRLFGRWLPFQRDFTGKASATIDDRKIRKFLRSHESLYDIPGSWRGSIYRYWEKQLNKDCLAKLQILLADYNRIVDTNKITKVANFRDKTTELQLIEANG